MKNILDIVIITFSQLYDYIRFRVLPTDDCGYYRAGDTDFMIYIDEDEDAIDICSLSKDPLITISFDAKKQVASMRKVNKGQASHTMDFWFDAALPFMVGDIDIRPLLSEILESYDYIFEGIIQQKTECTTEQATYLWGELKKLPKIKEAVLIQLDNIELFNCFKVEVVRACGFASDDVSIIGYRDTSRVIGNDKIKLYKKYKYNFNAYNHGVNYSVI